MNGYVRNKSNVWRHAMKRSIGPGAKIPLDELFEQYGKKHDLQEGQPFADWLKNIKLIDNQVWEVIYSGESEPKEKTEPKNVSKNEQHNQTVAPFVKSKMQPSDITNLTVRTARQELKKITDLDLLRYAYNEARTLSNKDSLCILLRKRIQELELTRR